MSRVPVALVTSTFLPEAIAKTSRSGGAERAGLPFGNIFPAFATKAVAANGSIISSGNKKLKRDLIYSPSSFQEVLQTQIRNSFLNSTMLMHN